MSSILRLVAAVLVFTLAAPTGFAGPWFLFDDTATHVEQAKDIVIAECLSDAGPAIDGLAPCQVQVTAVIKGERKPGKVTIYSDGLHRGRKYLLMNFGNYFGAIDFATNGELAAVEIPPGFDTRSILRRSPVEQVQAIYDARRSWVDGELEKLRNEKRSLDKSAPK